MKIQLLLFQITCLLFALSCDTQEPKDEMGDYFNEVLKRKAREKDMDSFIIPDSIDTKLIHAFYYEDSPKAHSIIVFDDSLRTTARRIKYYADSTLVEIDSLAKTAYNVFVSRFNKAEYVIFKEYVNYEVPTSSNLKSIMHFDRIDNRTY